MDQAGAVPDGGSGAVEGLDRELRVGDVLRRDPSPRPAHDVLAAYGGQGTVHLWSFGRRHPRRARVAPRSRWDCAALSAATVFRPLTTKPPPTCRATLPRRPDGTARKLERFGPSGEGGGARGYRDGPADRLDGPGTLLLRVEK